MVWKPIKGQEAIAGQPGGLARQYAVSGLKTADLVAKAERLRAAGGGLDAPAVRLPDDRVLGPGSGMAIGSGVPVGLGVRLEAIEERLGQQELRVDWLEEAIARMKIRSEAPVNEVGGETSFPGVSPVSPEEISAADRRRKYREANREKLRVQAQARRAKKRAEAGR